MAVRMCAGARQLTLMLYGARSMAMHLVAWATAAFDARYAIMPAPALMAAIEALLMITPPPWSFMCRAARWVPAMTPNRFTSMMREKSVRSSGRNRLSGLPTPALLNMM